MAGSRPSPEKWSPKEELGHLIDSAAINHHRIVRMQLEDESVMRGYDQERWVRLHAYQERAWQELTDVWVALNRQLLVVASTVTDSDWTRTCLTVAGAVTLKSLFRDYVAHMCHHLSNIHVLCGVAHEEPPTTSN